MSNKDALFRLCLYLKKYKIKIIIVTILLVITTISGILGPLIISYILDDYILAKKTDGFLFMICLLGLVYLINVIFDFLVNFIMIKASEDTLYDIRNDLFKHMEKLHIGFFDKNKKGDLMSRFTNDISIISNSLSEAVIQVIGSIITLIGVTIIMFVISPLLAFLTILTIPLLFFLAMLIGKKTSQYFLEQQDNLGKLESYSEEMIGGMKVVKSYQKENQTLKEFKKYNNNLKNSVIKAQVYSNLIMPINLIVTNIGNILLIACGSFMIIKGNLTIGSLIAFVSYSSMFRQPINQLASLFSSVTEGLAGAKRVFAIIDTKNDIKETKALNIDKIKGEVSFEHVDFGYSDNLVLHDINLKAKKGQVIALVGKTGAGKSTIASLLPRFYDVTSGKITIDGIDIRELSLISLRRRIDIILQDTYLFKGTIRENISYGNKNASIEEVIKASKKANAHSFIKRLPNGYDTLVLEEGSNLSIGERQLIAIARSILANKDILIMDEATSNVDTRTEVLINEGMKNMLEGKTVFVIAHRLKTVRDADEIVVLENGKIIERGKHEELLKLKQKYYKLYQNQFD